MIGFYIIAHCYIQGKCYCYGFSVRANNDEQAKEKVTKKFDRFLRRWMPIEIDLENDFKIITEIIEKHY